MLKGTYYTIEEVAVMIGATVKTINFWYAWKNTKPDNELVNLLPDFYQEGKRRTRYWNSEDVWKLAEFKAKVPKGRSGVMAEVTQKYRKRG